MKSNAACVTSLAATVAGIGFVSMSWEAIGILIDFREETAEFAFIRLVSARLREAARADWVRFQPQLSSNASRCPAYTRGFRDASLGVPTQLKSHSQLPQRLALRVEIARVESQKQRAHRPVHA